MRKNSNFYQRGEIATLLTIAAMVVVGLSVFISSVVTNRDPRTTSTSAVEGCNPYPTEPTTPNPRATSTERGYYWEANCNQSCTQNSECPKNTSQGEVYADTSNWCYGFSGGAKCMMLKYGLRPAGGATPTPVPPQATATPAGGICQAVGQACQEDYEYQNLSCHKRGGTCTCVGGGTCCSWGPGSCCGPIGSNCLAPTTAPTNAPTAIPPTPTNVPYVPPPVPPGSCGNLANGQTVCSNGVPVTCTDGNKREGSCPTNQTCPDGYARCQVINPTVQKCSDVTPVSSNYKNCTDVSHCGVLEKLGVRLTCVDGTALQPSVMPLCDKDANGKYPRFIWHWGALGSPADKKVELCPPNGDGGNGGNKTSCDVLERTQFQGCVSIGSNKWGYCKSRSSTPEGSYSDINLCNSKGSPAAVPPKDEPPPGPPPEDPTAGIDSEGKLIVHIPVLQRTISNTRSNSVSDVIKSDIIRRYLSIEANEKEINRGFKESNPRTTAKTVPYECDLGNCVNEEAHVTDINENEIKQTFNKGIKKYHKQLIGGNKSKNKLDVDAMFNTFEDTTQYAVFNPVTFDKIEQTEVHLYTDGNYPASYPYTKFQPISQTNPKFDVTKYYKYVIFRIQKNDDPGDSTYDSQGNSYHEDIFFEFNTAWITMGANRPFRIAYKTSLEQSAVHNNAFIGSARVPYRKGVNEYVLFFRPNAKDHPYISLHVKYFCNNSNGEIEDKLDYSQPNWWDADNRIHLGENDMFFMNNGNPIILDCRT